MRELSGIDEMIAASTLWDSIWSRAGAGHEVDPALMVALSHADGYLAAAFSGDAMVGAALGFWGSPAYGALHSHITGVVPAQAGRGIGTLIKVHQRDWVLARGGTAITWTYDPLVARNAHFNLNRLGARPERYLVDVYGELTDDLNRGDPSDRLLVRWALSQPAPEDPSPGDPGPAVGDPPAAALVAGLDGGPEIGVSLDDITPATTLAVAVPSDIAALRRRDPSTATLWRHAVRTALRTLIDRGWVITGFDRRYGYRLDPPHPSAGHRLPL